MPPPSPDTVRAAPPPRPFAARWIDYRLTLLRWRRRLKDRLPWVRRRVHRRLSARFERFAEAFLLPPPPADACPIHVAKAPASALGPEVCLFVTYAPLPRLKRHVLRHVEALRAAGVQVILVVNTPLPPERLELEPEFLGRLEGLYVRGNLGFDFAAWGHAWRLLAERLVGCERLILTNDSIVGPLRAGQLSDLLARVRASSADVIGLTGNPAPRYHLQSFFLVFQRRVLASPAFDAFWRGVRILPSKGVIVDLYETWLTAWLTRAGFACEALYQLGRDAPGENDAYFRWPELLEQGCPFVKASVLEECWASRTVKQLVPPEILDEYEFANRAGPGR